MAPDDFEGSVYARIARKRGELITMVSATGDDRRKKSGLETRIRFLTRLREQYDARRTVYPSQSVFMSYSKGTGEGMYLIAERIAVEQFGFRVLTGFQRSQRENILRIVRDGIEEAAVFLSIMTPEYEMGSQDPKSKRWAPSVWLIEEKGMALALDKPFRLLVHQDVHPDFWKRTTPEKLHTIFAPEEFEHKAQEALHDLTVRYEELLVRM